MAKQTSIQAKKALAEQMIVHEGMSAKAVSEALDVSAQSISKWRKATTTEKSWDDKRAEVLAAPHKIRELLMRELKVIAEGGTSVIDADALSKINKV
ncbi:MAG: transposase, partial [Flavobacteriaceae bacterium]|nr:transposase [Flavobacteriaceae bacterium]